MHLHVLHNQPDEPPATRVDDDTSGVPDTGPGDLERSPGSVVDWAFRRFEGRRLVVTTAFGMEGCVLIDMLAREGAPRTVHFLDTHFLFPETHRVRERLQTRYPHVHLVNAGTSLTPEQQEARHGAALWVHQPDRCCELRKVAPMRALLAGADAWMTGLRRTQSHTRASIRHVEWDERFEIVKVNPLAGWSREQVWAYALQNDVPYNELHERGYPSIGCTHCTRPVAGAGPETYTREGRWAGTSKTECGLHSRTSIPADGQKPPATGGL